MARAHNGSMWGTEHTVETTAGPEAVWARWQAVEAWPEWDESLEAASLEGPWRAGSRILLTRVGGRREQFAVETFREGQGFSLLGTRFLARVRWTCEAAQGRFGSRVTYRLEVEGPMAWWLRLFWGRRIQRDLPPAVRKLARLAAQG